MAKFTVGCVPFVNARPLVAWFESMGVDSPVEVVYEIPSLLPKMLNEGRADAVLASSIETLLTPGRTAAEGVCIGSFGRAESVRLFSKVPFMQIQTLALDESSMTSNALTLGLLDEVYGVKPVAEPCEPDQKAMLESHDACLMIGDKGMQASARGLQVLDMGEAWTVATRLPFVWALWIGRDDLSPRLVGLLNEALAWGMENIDTIIDDTVARSGWDIETCQRYLTKTMRYPLDLHASRGFEAYAELVSRCGLTESAQMPPFVAATGTTA